MTEFVVHGIAGSPYVRAVLLALEEKGLPWHLDAVPMGAQRDPDYRAIHPFQKIPTLDHADFRLYETAAILGYLDRTTAEPALTPRDSRDVARMDQLISITGCYLAPRVSGGLSFQRMVAPLIGMPVDETAVAEAVAPAGEVLDEVARLLGDTPFLVGGGLTLADLMIAPHLSFLPHFAEGQVLVAERPNLARWIERMEMRPSMAATTWDRLNEMVAARQTVDA
jgi:glutathione S-transferase